MRFQQHSQRIACVSSGLLAIVLLVWSVQWLWQAGAKYDSDPSRGALANQMMHRKSKAMHDILDGMVRGNWDRVETAAKQMEAYGETIAWYLPHSEYDNLGKAFQKSVEDLREAASQKNLGAAKEATLRLESSCIECHAQVNQRER